MALDVVGQTFAEFVTDMRRLLSDTLGVIWDLATVEQWVRMSIADYSLYFPRVKRVEGELFILPVFDFFRFVGLEEGGVIDIVQVWYGDTQAPTPEPILLSRLPNYSFENRDLHYSWFPQGQSLITAFNVDNRGLIRLSFMPIPSYPEKVTVFATVEHPSFALENADQLTVPASHYVMLRQFVIWQAWEERSNREAQAPDPTLSVLNTYAENAKRAHDQYLTLIRQALEHTLLGHSILTEWDKGVEYERIY